MKGCINKMGNSWGFTLTIGRDNNGKRIQKRFGKFKTKKDAEKACNEMIYQIEHGTFVDPKDLSLREYLNDWLRDYCKLRLTLCTYGGYKVNIEKHICPTLGNFPLQKLQPIQVQKLYNELLEKGLSPASIRYIHATLRKALNHAVKMQLIIRNVCDAVELPKVKTHESKFLNKNQVNEMLMAIKDTDVYLPTLLAVGLGLRRGEVLGLQWKDFDFNRNLVSIKRTLLPNSKEGEIFSECKTAKSQRVLAVPDSIMSYLKQVRKKQLENRMFFSTDYLDYDLVYCNPNGTPVTPGAFNHRFSNTLKDKGLEHMRVHDLRHTNASLMLSQGVSMKVASERLGHTTIGITMDLYSHIDEELQQDAAIRLDTVLCL